MSELKTSNHFIVRTPTEADWVRFTEAVEKYTDLKWGTWQKPTWNTNWSCYSAGSCIRVSTKLSHGNEAFYRNDLDYSHLPILSVDEGIEWLKGRTDTPPFSHGSAWTAEPNYTLKKQSLITTMTNLASRIFDKDVKTLVKAGYIDNCLNLTQGGTNALIGILFEEKKAELVKLAQEKIEEEKE